MSRPPTYQWIRLKQLGPVSRTTRRQMTTSTPTSTPQPSSSEPPPPPPPPQQESPTSDPALTSPLRTLLHAADDRALAEVAAHLAHVTALTQRIDTAIRTLTSNLSRLSPPGPASAPIPSYTPSLWAREAQLGDAHTRPVLRAARRVALNVADLQRAPYPADLAPPPARQFLRDARAWAPADKERERHQLRWDEESQGNRVRVAIDRVRRDVEERQRERERERRVREQGEVGRKFYAPVGEGSTTASTTTKTARTGGWGTGTTMISPLRTPWRRRGEGWGGGWGGGGGSGGGVGTVEEDARSPNPPASPRGGSWGSVVIRKLFSGGDGGGGGGGNAGGGVGGVEKEKETTGSGGQSDKTTQAREGDTSTPAIEPSERADTMVPAPAPAATPAAQKTVTSLADLQRELERSMTG